MHVRSNIDRYLADCISHRTETGLRDHLRACSRCRSHYDRQVVLHRTLAGDPEAPTPQEDDRMVRLVLQATDLERPHDLQKKRLGLMDRIIWAPAPILAVAVLMLLVVAGSVWYLMAPPVIAARLVKGRNLTLDEMPVDPKETPKTAVHAGSKLEVKKGGIAELTLERGGTVRVFPGSMLSLSGPGERLDLDRGKVWCLVENTGAPFVVQTDIAEVRVVEVRGARLVVEQVN